MRGRSIPGELFTENPEKGESRKGKAGRRWSLKSGAEGKSRFRRRIPI